MKTSSSASGLSRDCGIHCVLEVWKNQAGWNFQLHGPGWNLFNSPNVRFHSRSDAQHAAERTAAQLTITITTTVIK